LLTGNQSHLDPLFIEDINNKEQKWKVCLGVPYATSLWQVGNASEQNGFVKSEWYREKAKLMVWESEHSLPRAIRPEDVMPIMNRVFLNHTARRRTIARQKQSMVGSYQTES
jgi:hypothetical protein